ncbi:glycosyltransferase [Stigmatella erecta]|uniref:Glycosyltransferase, GT2 family n=1 Tax=Stigmatella erecta TaxID=83460 RepID=A0A1I0L8A9_9BACT|nr:glycosyltransferase [Stigmatella erecta]SEU35543.1 Glycosyltransferase, GT2 family [Stigmatella erecta]
MNHDRPATPSAPARPPPLPSLRDSVTPGGDELTVGDLADMVATQRRVVERLRACGGEQCAELVAHEHTLLLLLAQLHSRVGAPSSPIEDPVRMAHVLADVFQFEVPNSPRKHVGKAVSRAKRAMMKGLMPFHIEVLRPQREFNAELAMLVEQMSSHRSATLNADLGAQIRGRLEPLADPTAWRPRSHRASTAGGVFTLLKKSYLTTLGPVLRQLLEGQRRWNLAAVDALCVAVDWQAPAASRAERMISELEALSNPMAQGMASLGLRALSPIWNELLRRQVRFNQTVVRALAAIHHVNEPTVHDYQAWCAAHEPEQFRQSSRALLSLTRRPLLSLLTPTYNTPESVLRACLDSVRAQSYDRWEMCIADDGSTAPHVVRVLREYADLDKRIRFIRTPSNGGIAKATNAALDLVQGEYVCFLDHDDTLAPHALAEVALRLQAEPEADLLYSDEDRMDQSGRRVLPFFKPGWSPDLLRSANYICHFLVVKRDLLEKVGRIREGFDGAQDYDLILRVSEQAQRIAHIPRILYHWRMSAVSMAADVRNKPKASDAARRALADHLARCSEEAVIEEPLPTTFHMRYPVRGKPLVSIIVPFKDKPELLAKLVESLERHNSYGHYELLLISNNSVRPETHALLDRLVDPRIRKLTWNEPFNYSAINNFGVRNAQGELLLFLNNDVEALKAGWLEELIGQAQRPAVGAVGPKLVFPDQTIQHAGVILGMGGFAGHVFARLADRAEWTAFGHADWTRNYLAVTSACVMMRRDVFESVGGYDESFIVCGSDVELCLRIVAKGLRVVYTPAAKLLHDESATRRVDSIPEVDFWRSFSTYRRYLREGDPFYNPNLSLTMGDGTLRRDKRDGEAMAVQVLTTELPGSRMPVVSQGRANHQRHIAEHVPGMDCLPVEAERTRQQNGGRIAALQSRSKPLRKLSWFVPYFRHPFGGVHTILRFGHLMRTRHGVESQFVIYDNPHASAREMEGRARVLYDMPPGSFRVLSSQEDVKTLPECDLAIATFWRSAYLILKHPQAYGRAYFVQDFEPLFYPAGTMYGLAEQSYRLGLFGIFNTRGLHDFVTSNYGMKGLYFEPAVESSLFHDGRPPRTGPVRIFFYGRPSVERNAFELGLATLHQLKKELGGAVEILTAGEEWNPEQYGVRGVINNLGVLPYEKTADLYREIDVGLCFMFTKHPSYLPLEMMASGVTVVTNDNPANHWLLKHEENCLLAEPTFSGVLEQLRRAVLDNTARSRISATAAKRMRTTTWEQQVDQVYASLTSQVEAQLHAPAGGEQARGEPKLRAL